MQTLAIHPVKLRPRCAARALSPQHAQHARVMPTSTPTRSHIQVRPWHTILQPHRIAILAHLHPPPLSCCPALQPCPSTPAGTVDARLRTSAEPPGGSSRGPSAPTPPPRPALRLLRSVFVVVQPVRRPTSIGGAAGQFERQGFKFDVGSSMMFGLNDEPGNTNLITRALAHAGKRCPAVPDPTQLEYHLPRSPRFPDGLNVPVPRSYDAFLDILIDRFPHEEEGIRGFYGECWQVRRGLSAASRDVTET